MAEEGFEALVVFHGHGAGWPARWLHPRFRHCFVAVRRDGYWIRFDGRAGLPDLRVERVAVYLNEVLIAENGCRAASYTEEQGAAAMAPQEIVIRIELQRGAASAAVWTSDLSYDYVRINAEYRT